MPKPILRWAGGKNWLTHRWDRLFNSITFRNYYEPFLGGGSVFFSLDPQGESYLSDINGELIDTYLAIRDHVEDVVHVLQAYENTKTFYYQKRGEKPDNLIDRAARFIYLNQTSFNGIYRVNSQGRYNVPYGYRTKDFLEVENLFEASRCLQGAHITQNDFDSIRATVSKGDFVFLDPPYTVSRKSAENGFIKYNQNLFSLEDQVRLHELTAYLCNIGALFVLTNADHEVIRNLFSDSNIQIRPVQRASLIGGQNALRGQISELIITNIDVRNDD